MRSGTKLRNGQRVLNPVSTNGSGVHPNSAPGSRTLFPPLLRPAATTPPLRTLDSKPMCNAYNHPRGCRCGWGGEGYLGGNHLGGPGSVAQARPSWPADDFCRPTTCPVCGSSQVWFIRHNGGSIWVDSLGIPWPIHHCFDEGDSSSRPLHQLAAASRSLFEPRLGIITATRRDLILGDLHLDLAWGEGRTAKLRCRLAGPADGFLGDLVVVCARPPALCHPTLGTSPVQWVEGGSLPGPAVTAPSAPITEPAGRPLNSLNWTEEQLAEQEEKIIATVKAALEVAPSPMQNQKNAKQFALAGIRKLPRPLRNLLLHRFEKNRWRQPRSPPFAPLLAEVRRVRVSIAFRLQPRSPPHVL